ncbi:hypothetical protein [Streptomyces resistomycificus]|uniref:hypothetical protein n=1 Tax=Streptomyces resistomycificus TaxID=67356 RepID=UPI00069FB3BC|nr:hypothetical protein [Streptomyces resistomycificus]
MDCSVTTGCLVLVREERPARYGEATPAPQPDPPLYAALVTEWRARGRMVPGARDAHWTALVSDRPVAAHAWRTTSTADAAPAPDVRRADLAHVR